MERLVGKRFTTHANLYSQFPAQQSARPFHSTETALLKVHNDLVRDVDDCRVSQLVLLDLSAAFDTVDHQIILCVLSDRFGISSAAFNWSQSYLSERTQSFVHAGFATDCFVFSHYMHCTTRVRFWTTWIHSIHRITIVSEKHIVHSLTYADDIQLNDSSSLADAESISETV